MRFPLRNENAGFRGVCDPTGYTIYNTRGATRPSRADSAYPLLEFYCRRRFRYSAGRCCGWAMLWSSLLSHSHTFAPDALTVRKYCHAAWRKTARATAILILFGNFSASTEARSARQKDPNKKSNFSRRECHTVLRTFCPLPRVSNPSHCVWNVVPAGFGTFCPAPSSRATILVNCVWSILSASPPAPCVPSAWCCVWNFLSTPPLPTPHIPCNLRLELLVRKPARSV